jgi:ATP-binding cassette subfamily G (WHITE) protein 2 (PDR)
LVSPFHPALEFCSTNSCKGILFAYCIFNIFGALVLYWLIRMPKIKKAKKDKKEVGAHKGAVQEQVMDEPSHVGSSLGHNRNEKEEDVTAETRRYASITGATTPPHETASEKV